MTEKGKDAVLLRLLTRFYFRKRIGWPHASCPWPLLRETLSCLKVAPTQSSTS